MYRKLTFLLASVMVAACSSSVTDPTDTLAGLPKGLAVEFTMDPVEVGPHEPFTVSLKLTNTTARTITIDTPNQHLVHPKVTQGGERVLFRGSDLGVLPAHATHTFPPGEVVTRSWEVRAELMSTDSAGNVIWLPAQLGTYLVEVEFQLGGEGRRPAVGDTLKVK